MQMAFNPAKKKDKYQLHFVMPNFTFYAYRLIAFFCKNGCCMQKRIIRAISMTVISKVACTYLGKLAFRLSIDQTFIYCQPDRRFTSRLYAVFCSSLLIGADKTTAKAM